MVLFYSHLQLSTNCQKLRKMLIKNDFKQCLHKVPHCSKSSTSLRAAFNKIKKAVEHFLNLRQKEIAEPDISQ